jgi:hypothetical protein
MRGHGSHHNAHQDHDHHGRQRPALFEGPDSDKGQVYDGDLFAYGAVSFGNIAAGDTAQANLQIDADAHFKLVKIVGAGTLHGGTAPFQTNDVVECSLTMRDGGSGRDLFYAPVPVNDVWGSAQLPFITPMMRIFKAKANIIFSMVNYSASNQYDNISLTLWGIKLFEM